ncbi:MAG: hypothetical protein ACRDLU_02390 [Gaiellaceae bacterium]
MATYVAELYLPRGDMRERSRLDRRVRKATEEISAGGVPVRHVRSVFVPEDEIALQFFEAPAAEVVVEVSRRAGLAYERIVEATEHLFVPERDVPGGKEKGTWSEQGS